MAETTTPTPSRMPKIDLPTALVIIAGFGTVLGLVALHQSLGAISAFIGGCATAYLAYRSTSQGKTVEEVKTLANGNNEALREENRRLTDTMLAMSQDHSRTVAQLTNQMLPGSRLPSQLADPDPPQLDRAGHV